MLLIHAFCPSEPEPLIRALVEEVVFKIASKQDRTTLKTFHV